MTTRRSFCLASKHFIAPADTSMQDRHDDPVARLRQDDADWRSGQQALARALKTWRAEPAVAAVLAAVKRFGKGAAWEGCFALADLFAPNQDDARDRATRFADSLIAAGSAALDAHPLGQIPLAQGGRDAVPSLVLMASGQATLALAVYDGSALAALAPPRTARFQPVESWMRVLSGRAEAEHILRRDGDGTRSLLQSAPHPLEPGAVFHRYGPREALNVLRVRGTMVVLRLERQLDDAGPVREHDLADGRLLLQASPSKADSRDELIVSLLERMQRADALPAMARIALGGEAGDGAPPGAGVFPAPLRTRSEALRWQAVRAIAALDDPAARGVLARIAAQPEDPLAAPAATWLAENGRGPSWRR